jgi:hypothetical protein
MKNRSQVAELAGWLAILATGATIFLVVTLHVLSPEFSPSWRVVSEYAFGHYAWVLSLMFSSWGIGSWALVVAIDPRSTPIREGWDGLPGRSDCTNPIPAKELSKVPCQQRLESLCNGIQ